MLHYHVLLLLQPTHRNKFNVFAALVRYDTQREACISTFNLRRRQRLQWDDGESFVTLNLGPAINCYINFCQIFSSLWRHAAPLVSQFRLLHPLRHQIPYYINNFITSKFGLHHSRFSHVFWEIVFDIWCET